RAVVFDSRRLVVVDRLAAIVPHPMRLVILDFNVLALLGVNVDLLFALLVLAANLVEVLGRALEAAPALDAALRPAGRQVVGRHHLGVVDAAGDDGLVRVALQEVHDDLLADARDVDDAPVLAGPQGADAAPAGAV